MEELLKVLIETLHEIKFYYRKQNEVLGLIALEAQRERVTRKKTVKEEKTASVVEQPAAKPSAAAASAFGLAPVEETKAPAEDTVEAARRCQEVIGLFIRRHLKAVPPGLDRAKAIIQEVCPNEVGKKIEEFAYTSNLKLIPRFESELEKAA